MQWTCTGTSFSRSMAEQNCSKILVRRILEIHRNMDVGHAETADARRLVRQRLVMGVEPQVDNVADAESVDIGQSRFGRLAGCRSSALRCGTPHEPVSSRQGLAFKPRSDGPTHLQTADRIRL